MALRPSLLRFFATRMRSWASAEDLVQELYLRALRQDESAQPVDDAKAWLFRVGLNLMIDAQRSAARAADRDRSALIGEYAGETLIAQEPSPEAAADSRLRMTRLLGLVEAMPDRMREAFQLHKIEGLTQAETARRMGVSVKAVEKHLAMALERLVKAMPEERR